MRIAIADDHQIIRVGLRAILSQQPDMEVVGEADTARGALALVTAEQPDVAIIDLNLPDGSGLSIVPALPAAAPATRVLVLSMHSEPEMVRRALATGIHGYLNKAAEPDEVVRAVRSVAGGRSFLSIPLERTGLGEFLSSEEVQAPAAASAAPRGVGKPLSEREREVLTLFARGLTHRQIADLLGVRVKTVETYRSRLGDKFGARSRAELLRCARELGMLIEESPPL